MKSKFLAAPSIDLDRPITILPKSHDAVAETALALMVALLRALKERGVLSPAEIDDLLSEAGKDLGRAENYQLVESVRSLVEQDCEE